jgi:hypothetical protein
LEQHHNERNPEIGTAWHGKHVIIVICNRHTDQVLNVQKSLHAPYEPPHVSCAETLSRLFSIGYRLIMVVPLSNFELQYILTTE